MHRRQFLKTAAAGTGLLILPSGARAGKNAPGNKLNVALIGVWGRGLAHYDVLAGENVVALCDVNEKRFPEALKRFPKAKTYVDWPKCLDQKDIDAVVMLHDRPYPRLHCQLGINRDLHVYMEKPLAISVEEARVVRTNWLKKKDKLATQVGMQRHAMQNFNRVRELIRDGAVGELKAASRGATGRSAAPATCPRKASHRKVCTSISGSAPLRSIPTTPAISPAGRARTACRGTCIGTSASARSATWAATPWTWRGTPSTPRCRPRRKQKARSSIPTSCRWNASRTSSTPANDWRGPIRISWYQGGAMPLSPTPHVDLKQIDHGAMFTGSKGHLIADFGSRLLLPSGDNADLTYYKPRTQDKLLPPLGDFQRQWLAACKDTSRKTACDFEYSGNMIEQLLLGLVAYRVGKKLDYDGAAGRVTNSPEANELLRRQYRPGWTLDG